MYDDTKPIDIVNNNCVNCSINLCGKSKIQLKGEIFRKVRTIISERIAPLPVTESDYVCLDCLCLQSQQTVIFNGIKILKAGEKYECTTKQEHCCKCLLCAQSSSNQNPSSSEHTDSVNHLNNGDESVSISHCRNNCSAYICQKCRQKSYRVVLKKQPAIVQIKTSITQNSIIEMELEPEVMVKQEPPSEDPLKYDSMQIKTEIKQELPDDEIETSDLTSHISNSSEDEVETPKNHLRKQTPIKEPVSKMNDLIHPDTSDEEWLPLGKSSSSSYTPKEKLPTIVLPNYRRGPVSASRCIITGCKRKERRIIPMSVRKNIFIEHNIYLAYKCRVCCEHSTKPSWHLLCENKNLQNSFTANNIEEMLDFSKNNEGVNFENYEAMDKHLFKYHLGISKEEFRHILSNEPHVAEMKTGRTALAACIMKSFTGDPDVKISSLLGISRTTLRNSMSKVEDLLQDKSLLVTGRKKKNKKKSPKTNLIDTTDSVDMEEKCEISKHH